MLLIRRIEITNFACFDQIEIRPSANPGKALDRHSGGETDRARPRFFARSAGACTVSRGFRATRAASPCIQPHGNRTRTASRPRVSILFETDGSSRHHLEGKPTNIEYELRRTVTTIHREPSAKDNPDFRRVREDAQLLERERDGSWVPNVHGVGRVIEELLPWSLRDFVVMDADEAADFVGGSENKEIQRHEVIGKTSYAVRALLGLEVFDGAAGRVASLRRDFERDATRATRNAELAEKQAELDHVRGKLAEFEQRLDRNRHARADTDERLAQGRGRLEALIGSLGAHDALRQRLADNEKHTRRAREDRRSAVRELSADLTRVEMLASLAAREVRHVEQVLQPLYDDGSIPVRHLAFVKRLLETGTCVCGQDLSSASDHANHIQEVIDRSTEQKDHADHLAEVLDAATALGHHADGRGVGGPHGRPRESRCGPR